MTISQSPSGVFTVGVAGASACGKSTFLKAIGSCLYPGSFSHLDMDGFHRRNRAGREALEEWPDEPRANDFEQLLRHLDILRNGKPTAVPTYDHVKGDHGPLREVQPAPFVFVEGLHAIFINDLRPTPVLDIAVYLAPDNDLRRSWKVRRDVNERCYGFRDAVRQIDKRTALEREFIEPQRERADIVICTSSLRHRYTRYSVLADPGFFDSIWVSSDEEVSSPLIEWSETEWDGSPYIHVKSLLGSTSSETEKTLLVGTNHYIRRRCAFGRLDPYRFSDAARATCLLIILKKLSMATENPNA